MKRNRCHRREEVSLLAAGVLGEEGKRELERHLADCPECRAYRVEMRSVVEPLGEWKKSLSTIEVSAAAQGRWERVITSESATTAVPSSPLAAAWRIIWHELIRPSRYAWAGMAALWLAMLVVNFSSRTPAETGRVAVSPQEMQRNWEEQNRVLAELNQPSFGFVAPAPVPAVLKPRSEKARGREVI